MKMIDLQFNTGILDFHSKPAIFYLNSMGVKNLMKWIEERAPGAIKNIPITQLLGRTVAIDASLQIYQFLVAIRHMGSNLVDAEGNTTSHLSGLLSRTLYFIQNGIRPVYVFDGKPPQMKSGELQKRAEKREEAEKALKEAIEQGNEEDIDRFTRRTVHMDPQHIEDCKKLLTLMGVPFVQAPCEAEAECAALCRAGLVDATATEDMDALAHSTPILLRNLTRRNNQNSDSVIQIDFQEVLQESQLTREEFIDFCILCGCDYCDTIKHVGPKTAYEVIREHHSIEEVVKNLDHERHPIPDDFDYAAARQLFLNHEVDVNFPKFTFKKPDEEGLKEFMINEKGFSQSRIESAIKKLKDAKRGGQQTRMDSFFSTIPKPAKPQPAKTKKSEKKPPAKQKKK